VSGTDKRTTNAFYEIEIEPETKLPVRITVSVLTARKGTTEIKGEKIVGGQHVAFHFEYQLSEFDKVSPPKIPPEAGKLLAKN
jgi:hypothetical protein